MSRPLSELKAAVDEALRADPNAGWFVSCYETLDFVVNGTVKSVGGAGETDEPPDPEVTYRCPICGAEKKSRDGPMSCSCQDWLPMMKPVGELG